MQMSHRGLTSNEALAGSTATETSCQARGRVKIPSMYQKICLFPLFTQQL